MGNEAWKVKHPWPSIKAQALADFFVECTLLKEVKAEVEVVALILASDLWTLYVDGASNA